MRKLRLANSDRVALVDDHDVDRCGQWEWFLRKKGYAVAVVAVDGKPYQTSLHRYVMGCRCGDGRRIDHANGQTLDCRRENLRDATATQNGANRRAAVLAHASRASSRFKGVRFVGHTKKGARWAARVAGVTVGWYVSEEEAARAYDDAARERWGEFACLNFAKPGERSALREPPNEAAA